MIECALDAETLVSNFTQYKLFIGDDKKNTIFGVTFSFNVEFCVEMLEKTSCLYGTVSILYETDVWIVL